MRYVAPLWLSVLTACSTTHVHTEMTQYTVGAPVDGAQLFVVDDRGERELGPAPQALELETEVRTTEFDVFPSWVVTGILVASLVGSIYVTAKEAPDGKGLAGGITGTVLSGIATGIAIPVTVIGTLSEPDVRRVPKHGQIKIITKHGNEEYSQDLPTSSRFVVEMSPETRITQPKLTFQKPMPEPMTAREQLESIEKQPAPPDEIRVALFFSETSERMTPDALQALSSYFSVRVASVPHVRLVPSQTMQAVLREEKRTGYSPCYDEACQIELGKAVGANKTLIANVLPLGDTCVVVATMFDLRTELSERAESERSACDLTSLSEASDRVVERLHAPGDVRE